MRRRSHWKLRSALLNCIDELHCAGSQTHLIGSLCTLTSKYDVSLLQHNGAANSCLPRGFSWIHCHVGFVVHCLLSSVSQSVSGTLDGPRVVAPSKTCGHARSSRRRWCWAQCRHRSAVPTFGRVVLAGASLLHCKMGQTFGFANFLSPWITQKLTNA